MSATAIPALDNSLGSMLIGVIVSAVLYGVALLQAFNYFTNYVTDPWFLKALVGMVVIFDSVHMILISHSIYHYTITNYFNPAALGLMEWSLLLEALFTTLGGAGVQLFYISRIWKMSKKNIPLTAVIAAIVLANAAWTALAMQFETFENLLKISNLTVTINALSTATDILIAGTLCYMLNKARTGFKRSDTIINRLIMFVVNTGVMCAIASLVSVLASPNTLIYASFYFCIGRLYTNSLLATLNARRSITSSADGGSHMLVSIPPSIVHPTSSTGDCTGVKSATAPNISIRIDTTKESMRGQNGLGTESYEKDEYLSQKGHAF
ncbi:hypothetical protein DXG01_010613 [Tephrocybe rancida]|nr:hypothetical protein DXG01_010613 [Tephrocybe rancida]